VCVEVQPKHSEVGTSLTYIILYTERELDLREFMVGVFWNYERKLYPEESLVLWSTIEERPIDACFM